MSKYLISIIIPYHNVPIDTFKKCFDSIKNQTIGFNNIELIIVVHNSEDLFPSVKQLVKDFDNVKVLLANNEIRNASSPRNIGFKIATGELVAYVDADDWMPINCLKPVIACMQDKSIDIGITRRDYLSENESVTPIATLVLWDQTQEKIMVTRDAYDNQKMFSGFWGGCTCKFYRREFLSKNNLLYDETVDFFEDFVYSATAFNVAKKICIMPQYITYTYFINQSSTVQNGNKSPETLIKYAKGYKKLFNLMNEYGFWIDDTVCNMCYYLSLLIVKNKLITYEDRLKIKNILEPFLCSIAPLKPSKLYSKKQIREFYHFPKDVILNIDKDATDNFLSTSNVTESIKTEQKVLNEIIEYNMDTDFGRRYGFADIFSFSQYISQVPLTDINTYQPLIELTSKVCETGIYSSDKTSEYLCSFDSDNTLKLLPSNNLHISIYLQQLKKIIDNNVTYCVYPNIYSSKKYNDGNYLVTIYDAMIKHYLLDNRLFNTVFDNKCLNPQYAFYVLNINNEKISKIFAENTHALFIELKNIKDNFVSICNDIEKGTIGEEIIKGNYLFSPNKKRAEYLRNIYKIKKGNITLKDIWPNLKEIDADYGTVYQKYSDLLSADSKDIKFRKSLLYIPEAMLGIEIGSNHYKLNLEAGFFEFIDIAENTKKPYRYKQLIPGRIYNVIVTNYAGLYRYITNYKILVNRYDNDDLIFSPVR